MFTLLSLDVHSIVVSVSVCLYVICLSVCLSDRRLAYVSYHMQISPCFSEHVYCGHGSVLMAVLYFMYFRFVDDVIIWHNGVNGPVVHW